MKKLFILFLACCLVFLFCGGAALAGTGTAIVDELWEEFSPRPDGNVKLTLTHNDDEMFILLTACDEEGYIRTGDQTSVQLADVDGYYGEPHYRIIVSRLENGMYLTETVQDYAEQVRYAIYSLTDGRLREEIRWISGRYGSREEWCEELNGKFEGFGISFSYKPDLFINGAEYTYPTVNRPDTSVVVLYAADNPMLPSYESEKEAAMAHFTPEAPTQAWQEAYLAVIPDDWKLGESLETTSYAPEGSTLWKYAFTRTDGCKLSLYIDPATGLLARATYSEDALYKGQYGFNAKKLLAMEPSEQLLQAKEILCNVLSLYQPEAAQAMAGLPLTGTKTEDMGGGPTLTTEVTAEGLCMTYKLQYQTAGAEQLTRGISVYTAR